VNLRDQLLRDEGLRLHPYRDSVGKLTIGIGRNLDDVGITPEEAFLLLDNDIETATLRLLEALPWTAGLDTIRLAVLINMTFNLGIGGLVKFKNTLAMVQAGQYAEAGQAMLQSKWAKQVGPRADRLALQMESGVWQ
jgi:lysozyme